MIIKTVEPLDNYLLKIQTEDGQQGIFDLTPYLQYEVFIPLTDNTEFKKITNGKYYVEWASGADLSADTIDAHIIYDTPVGGY